MEMRSSPRIVTSKKKIQYRSSTWRVHEFEVWSRGEAVCRAAALWMRDSVLVWVGAPTAREPARLGGVALAVPAAGGALATPLAGDAGPAAALARRLAARTQRPAIVCCGAHFDRFTMPLVERGLVAQIKSRTDVSDT